MRSVNKKTCREQGYLGKEKVQINQTEKMLCACRVLRLMEKSAADDGPYNCSGKDSATQH